MSRSMWNIHLQLISILLRTQIITEDREIQPPLSVGHLYPSMRCVQLLSNVKCTEEIAGVHESTIPRDVNETKIIRCKSHHVTESNDLFYTATCLNTARLDHNHACSQHDYYTLDQKLFDNLLPSPIPTSVQSIGDPITTVGGYKQCISYMYDQQGNLAVYDNEAEECWVYDYGQPWQLEVTTGSEGPTGSLDIYVRGHVNVAQGKKVYDGNGNHLPEASKLVDGVYSSDDYDLDDSTVYYIDLYYWYLVTSVQVALANKNIDNGLTILIGHHSSSDIVPNMSPDTFTACNNNLDSQELLEHRLHIRVCTAPTKGRYVKFLTNEHPKIFEIAVYASQEMDNAAYGKNVSSSGAYNNQDPAKLVDSIASPNAWSPFYSYYFTAGVSNGNPAWVNVDLGTHMNIYRIGITNAQPGSPQRETMFDVLTNTPAPTRRSDINALPYERFCLKEFTVNHGETVHGFCFAIRRARNVTIFAATDKRIRICEIDVLQYRTKYEKFKMIYKHGHMIRYGECPTWPGTNHTEWATDSERCSEGCGKNDSCVGFLFDSKTPRCHLLTNLSEICTNHYKPSNVTYNSTGGSFIIGTKIKYCPSTDQLNGTWYNMSFTYTCPLGQAFDENDPSNNSQIYYCHTTGWYPNSLVPNCTAVLCELDPQDFPEFTNLTGTSAISRHYDPEADIIPVECLEGYVRRDSSPINYTERYDEVYNLTCQPNGTFYPLTPCREKPCFHAALENTTEVNLEGVFEQNITINCTVGHRITGFSNNVKSYDSVCLSNGTWSLTMDCFPVFCSITGPLNSSHSEGNMTGYYLDQLTVTCNLGYVVEEKDVNLRSYKTTCKDSGQWSETNNCERIRCLHNKPNFINVEGNFSITDMDGLYEDEITMHCIIGYVVDGTWRNMTYISKCGPTGSWSRLDVCEVIRCDIVAPENVEETEILGKYEDMTTVHCEPGYRAPDSNVNTTYNATCQANGNWSVYEDCKRVQCPNENLTDGLNSTLYGFYGDNLTVSCITGHVTTLQGADIINAANFQEDYVIKEFDTECLANGTWSGPKSCIPIFCYETAFENTTKQYAVGRYPQTISYDCCDGFWTQDGHLPSGTAQCGDDGNWIINNCIRITCEPLHVPHSDADATPGVYLEQVKVNCDYNYETPQGVLYFSATCVGTGNWSYVDICRLRQCDPLTLENTNVTNQTIPAGEEALGQCHLGYETEAGEENFIMRCNQNREYRNVFNCSKKFCRAITVFNSKSTSNIVQEYQSKTNCTCLYGYKNQDGSTEMEIECQHDKTWSRIPVCSAVPCSAKGPRNTNEEWLNSTFPISKLVKCKKGYKLPDNGRSYVTKCQGDGTWNKLIDCTIHRCPALSGPIYGWREDVPESDYGTSIKVTCMEGFETNIKATTFKSYCNEYGFWNATKCFKIKCPPFSAYNVPFNGLTGRYGDEMNITCPDGFETDLGETSYMTFCTSKGRWQDQKSCWRRNCSALTIENTNIVNMSGAVGSNITGVCNYGYFITPTLNEFNIYCSMHGEWDIPKTNCTLVECRPFQVANTIVPKDMIVRGTYGDVIQVVCKEGYKIKNTLSSITTTCYSTSDWSWKGSCNAVHCPPLTPSKSVISDRPTDTTTYNTEYEFICAPGYSHMSFTAPAFVRCQKNKQWTEIPTCKPNCPPIHPGSHIVLSSELTEIGVMVSFSCDKGFIVQGSDSTTCQENGQWSHSQPRCMAEPVDGRMAEWQAWAPAHCPVTCGEGFQWRERYCIPPRHGGKACIGDLRQRGTCNEVPCPIDGVVSEWSEWSSCTKTCGISYQIRERSCSRAQFGGKDCSKVKHTEISKCTVPDCPAPPEAIHGVKKLALQGQFTDADERTSAKVVALTVGIGFIGLFVGIVVACDILRYIIKWDTKRAKVVTYHITRTPPQEDG